MNPRYGRPGVMNPPRGGVPPLPVPVDFMLSRSATADSLTKTGDGYEIPATGHLLPATVDLRGKRVMHVLKGTADVTLLSGDVSAALVSGAFGDGTPAARIVVAGVQGPLMQWTADRQVAEFEVTSTGMLRVWLDGFEYASAPIDVSAPLTVDRIGGTSASTQADVVMMAEGDAAGHQIREVLLRQHVPALAPIPQTQVVALDTGRVTMLDPQMEPKQLMAADAAQGIDRTNPANAGYYHDLAYRNHAEAPVSLSGTVGPMSVVRALVPGARYLRTGINQWQFDADGNMLSADYQQKLDEWVAAGGKWMPVHMWLGQEKWPQPITDQGQAAEVDYVLNTIPTVYLEGWRRFWLWYAKQPWSVQAAIDVIDLLNEPDIFNRVPRRDPGTPIHVWRRRFVELQIAAARLVPDQWRGIVLATGWGYSTGYTQLQELDPYNVSPVARLKQALGQRLKWSFHQYPGWASGSTPDAYYTETMKKATFTGPGNLILTEMNSGDFNPVTDVDAPGFQMARVMSRLTKAGVGLGFFPGINFAAAIGFTSSSVPEFRRPDRTASFIDAATITDETPYEVVNPQVVVQPSEAEPGGVQTTGVHIRIGGTGGDTFIATTSYRTMFFGSKGDDTITLSPTAWTWVYGQDGNDTIHAETGPGGLIFLGEGDDRVYLGADRLSVHGAQGGDVYVLKDSGHAYIDNFAVGADEIDVNGIFPSLAAFKAACANVSGHLVITMPGGGLVTLLKRGTTDPAFLVPALQPPGATFPALAGTIHHYRVEDATDSGIEVAHGVSLPLALVGTLATVDVGGVLFVDGEQCGFMGTKASWGDPTFSVWMLLDGTRPAATAIYHGPNPSGSGNNSLFFRASGTFSAGSGSVTYPALPAADGPETLNWETAINNANMGQVSLYHDGVLIGTPASGSLSRVFDFTGTELGLGVIFTGGVPAPSGVRWRDIVIKRGGTFTAAEKQALHEYAQARLLP